MPENKSNTKRLTPLMLEAAYKKADAEKCAKGEEITGPNTVLLNLDHIVCFSAAASTEQAGLTYVTRTKGDGVYLPIPRDTVQEILEDSGYKVMTMGDQMKFKR